LSELPCEGWNLGVFGIVACAAAPRAALSGVAGTGVGYPLEFWDAKLAAEYGCGKGDEAAGICVLIVPRNGGPPVEPMLDRARNLGG
jgi:hypothetical protein